MWLSVCVCVCEQIGRSERICLYFSPSKTSKNCELYGWLLTGSLYSTFCQCKSCQDDGVLCTTIFTYNVSHIAKIDEHMGTCMRTIRIIRRLGCPIFGSNRLSEHLALKCKNALPFFFTWKCFSIYFSAKGYHIQHISDDLPLYCILVFCFLFSSAIRHKDQTHAVVYNEMCSHLEFAACERCIVICYTCVKF